MIAQTIEMNVEQFWSLANGIGLDTQRDSVYIAVLLAQASVETDWFKSPNYMEANNMFGMRPAKKRPQNRVGIRVAGNNGEFAVFATLNESLRDRIAWDSYNNISRPQTWDDVTTYMAIVMQKGYTHESTYIQAWKDRLGRYVEAFDNGAVNVDFVGGADDADGLFDNGGSGGLGLIDGYNKFKLKYGLIGVVILAVGGYFAYKYFKKR